MSDKVEKVVNELTRLPSGIWRAIIVKMTWISRGGGSLDDVPRQLRRLGEMALDRDLWEQIHARVAGKRRAQARIEQRVRARKDKIRRREYMRRYMAQRRAEG